MRALVLLLLVLCSCNSYVTKPVIPFKDVEQASHSTVALVKPTMSLFGASDSQDLHDFFCSGSFISPTIILTANHCVEDTEIVKVSTYVDYLETQGDFDKYAKFVVVKKSKRSDLAMLVLMEGQEKYLSYHTWVPLADRSPHVGEKVYIVGHPSEEPWTYTVDIVSSEQRWIGGGKFLQHQTPVYFGNSGGPVFSMDGKLVGVVSMITEHVSHLNFSVHLDEIKYFLESK